jgi:hypothetical protein
MRSRHLGIWAVVLGVVVGGILIARPASAAIGFRAATSNNNGNGTTSLSLTMPTGTLQDDVLIAVVTWRTSTTTITPPSGWTAVINGTGSVSGNIQQATYYRVATSGEAGPYSFTFSTTSKASGVVAAYTGVETSNPINIASTNSVSTANATMSTNSVTTTSPNTMLVGAYGNAAGTTFGVGSGMTLRGQSASSGGGTASRTTTGLQDMSQVAAGATGVKTMTSGASAVYIATLIALQPRAVLTQASYRWFQNVDSTTVTTAVATKDTATGLAQDTPVRLRLNVGAGSTGGPYGSGNNVKLQYAQKSGVCDTSFSGESYSDITSTSPVSYYNNPTPADGSSYVVNAGDPTRAGITSIPQYYKESNPLTVASPIPAGQDGLWDVPLMLRSNSTSWSNLGSIGGQTSWGSSAISQDGQRIVVGAAGRVPYYSTDGGISFVAGSGTANSASLAMSYNGLVVLGAANGGKLSYSGDGGASWSTLANSPSIYWYDTAVSSDGSRLYAASGYVYYSSDAGVTWTAGTGVSGGNSVATSSNGTKLVAGTTSGYIYTSTDSGSTWTARTGSGSRSWESVASSADGSILYASENSGSIYRSADSGATWTSLTAAGIKSWRTLSASADGTSIVAVAANDSSYISLDSGLTWSAYTAGSPPASWGEVSMSANGNKVATPRITSGNQSFATIAKYTPTSYCIRAVTSTGSLLDTYSVIPELNPLPTSYTQSSYRWFANSDSTVPGAAIASQDTSATVAPDTQIRLRSRLAVDAVDAVANSADAFKIQYAEKVGVCDPSFTGESYMDLYNPTVLSQDSEAGDVVEDTSSGSRTWVNPQNAILPDLAYATASSKSTGWYNSTYLKTSLHNFSVPANAIIRGVSVYGDVSMQTPMMPGFGQVASGPVRLVKNGVIVGDDRGSDNSFWSSSGLWGGPKIQWGVPLTPSDVNSASFGSVVSAAISADGTNISSARVDALRMSVYYTLPAANAFEYGDNGSLVDNAAIASIGTDPTNGARTAVYQTYRESDPMPITNTIASGSDGLWDFVFVPHAAALGKAYCFRIVKADGGLLNSYSQIPELTVSPPGPTLDQQLRGGQSYQNGSKTPLVW